MTVCLSMCMKQNNYLCTTVRGDNNEVYGVDLVSAILNCLKDSIETWYTLWKSYVDMHEARCLLMKYSDARGVSHRDLLTVLVKSNESHALQKILVF